jgi:hypothetical protein
MSNKANQPHPDPKEAVATAMNEQGFLFQQLTL